MFKTNINITLCFILASWLKETWKYTHEWMTVFPSYYLWTTIYGLKYTYSFTYDLQCTPTFSYMVLNPCRGHLHFHLQTQGHAYGLFFFYFRDTPTQGTPRFPCLYSHLSFKPHPSERMVKISFFYFKSKVRMLICAMRKFIRNVFKKIHASNWLINI